MSGSAKRELGGSDGVEVIEREVGAAAGLRRRRLLRHPTSGRRWPRIGGPTGDGCHPLVGARVRHRRSRLPVSFPSSSAVSSPVPESLGPSPEPPPLQAGKASNRLAENRRFGYLFQSSHTASTQSSTHASKANWRCPTPRRKVRNWGKAQAIGKAARDGSPKAPLAAPLSASQTPQ